MTSVSIPVYNKKNHTVGVKYVKKILEKIRQDNPVNQNVYSFHFI